MPWHTGIGTFRLSHWRVTASPLPGARSSTPVAAGAVWAPTDFDTVLSKDALCTSPKGRERCEPDSPAVRPVGHPGHQAPRLEPALALRTNPCDSRECGGRYFREMPIRRWNSTFLALPSNAGTSRPPWSHSIALLPAPDGPNRRRCHPFPRLFVGSRISKSEFISGARSRATSAVVSPRCFSTTRTSVQQGRCVGPSHVPWAVCAGTS